MVTNILRGVGFKGWKRAMFIALSGKNKKGFVYGTIKRSTTYTTQGKAWYRVNDIVI